MRKHLFFHIVDTLNSCFEYFELRYDGLGRREFTTKKWYNYDNLITTVWKYCHCCLLITTRIYACHNWLREVSLFTTGKKLHHNYYEISVVKTLKLSKYALGIEPKNVSWEIWAGNQYFTHTVAKLWKFKMKKKVERISKHNPDRMPQPTIQFSLLLVTSS